MRENTVDHPLLQRWGQRPVKRLLALDGGGVRGVVTLAFLKRIETLLREKGQADTLADYFDLIGGTSTGAIIAAALASGSSVDWIREKYETLAVDVFATNHTGWLAGVKEMLSGVLSPKFPSESLQTHLKEYFDFPLGSDKLKTGLMIMIRRADTASPWPVHNNPVGKYYAGPPENSGEQWMANKDFNVADLVLASTAAPSYFEPQKMVVGRLPNGHPEVGLFVDGGVTPHNNPALALLRLATLSGYGFNWELGTEKLQLVSVGTGAAKLLGRESRLAGKFAVNCLKALMDDCADDVELTLQWLSQSPTARRIDGEVDDLSKDLLGVGPLEGRPALLHYLRYNFPLDGYWLKQVLGCTLGPDKVKALREMDRPENLVDLAELAELAAERLIMPDHFAAARNGEQA